jgi:hypothetical protein
MTYYARSRIVHWRRRCAISQERTCCSNSSAGQIVLLARRLEGHATRNVVVGWGFFLSCAIVSDNNFNEGIEKLRLLHDFSQMIENVFLPSSD